MKTTPIYAAVCSVMLSLCAMFPNHTHAQAPQKMSYQAVLRDASQALLDNQSIGMRISILNGPDGTNLVFAETQSATTNSNGLVTLELGAGIPELGTFGSIDWANGPYFIQTETDPTGGTQYQFFSTSQLLSVPYAL